MCALVREIVVGRISKAQSGRVSAMGLQKCCDTIAGGRSIVENGAGVFAEVREVSR